MRSATAARSRPSKPWSATLAAVPAGLCFPNNDTSRRGFPARMLWASAAAVELVGVAAAKRRIEGADAGDVAIDIGRRLRPAGPGPAGAAPSPGRTAGSAARRRGRCGGSRSSTAPRVDACPRAPAPAAAGRVRPSARRSTMPPGWWSASALHRDAAQPAHQRPERRAKRARTCRASGCACREAPSSVYGKSQLLVCVARRSPRSAAPGHTARPRRASRSAAAACSDRRQTRPAGCRRAWWSCGRA